MIILGVFTKNGLVTDKEMGAIYEKYFGLNPTSVNFFLAGHTKYGYADMTLSINNGRSRKYKTMIWKGTKEELLAVLEAMSKILYFYEAEEDEEEEALEDDELDDDDDDWED